LALEFLLSLFELMLAFEVRLEGLVHYRLMPCDDLLRDGVGVLCGVFGGVRGCGYLKEGRRAVSSGPREDGFDVVPSSQLVRTYARAACGAAEKALSVGDFFGDEVVFDRFLPDAADLQQRSGAMLSRLPVGDKRCG